MGVTNRDEEVTFGNITCSSDFDVPLFFCKSDDIFLRSPTTGDRPEAECGHSDPNRHIMVATFIRRLILVD
jgi:hypothetical protein